MPNCTNCNNEVNAKFCSNCGQAVVLERINSSYLINEMASVLNFERGFLYTIKKLLTKPGQSVKSYLLENRKKLVKPILFIILTSLLYSLCNDFFNYEKGYIQYGNLPNSTTTLLLQWIQNNYGYANILMGIFIAFFIKLFFKKYEFNFFEIIILLCYVMGIGMLIYAFSILVDMVIHVKLLQFGGFIGFVYTTWAIADFFDKRKVSNYLKAFFAYLLGMISFFVVVILIGKLIDTF